MKDSKECRHDGGWAGNINRLTRLYCVPCHQSSHEKYRDQVIKAV
jgi:hypothetical protein